MFYWIVVFISYVSMILMMGILLGASGFVGFGLIFSDYDFLFLLKKGAWVGLRYAGVWAGGIGIVLCIMKAKKKYDEKKKKEN